MSSRAFGLKPTIVDRIFGQNVASSVTFIVAGALLTAIAAQFVVRLYPVPVTAQTLAVLVVGMSLGAVRGALAMVLYAALGVAGLPVFSNATSGIDVLVGPSGGYIVGFIVSAGIAGWFAERHWDRDIVRAIAAATIATAATFTAGLFGLWVALQRLGHKESFASLIEAGVTPFLVGAAIKILLSAAILSFSWRAVLRADPKSP